MTFSLSAVPFPSGGWRHFRFHRPVGDTAQRSGRIGVNPGCPAEVHLLHNLWYPEALWGGLYYLIIMAVAIEA